MNYIINVQMDLGRKMFPHTCSKQSSDRHPLAHGWSLVHTPVLTCAIPRKLSRLPPLRPVRPSASPPSPHFWLHTSLQHVAQGLSPPKPFPHLSAGHCFHVFSAEKFSFFTFFLQPPKLLGYKGSSYLSAAARKRNISIVPAWRCQCGSESERCPPEKAGGAAPLA